MHSFTPPGAEQSSREIDVDFDSGSALPRGRKRSGGQFSRGKGRLSAEKAEFDRRRHVELPSFGCNGYSGGNLTTENQNCLISLTIFVNCSRSTGLVT